MADAPTPADAPPHAFAIAGLLGWPVAPLLAVAKARGNATVNGRGLLLNQARPAFEAGFGVMSSIGPGHFRAVEATY